ncbi:MAG: hypothetical protein ACK5NK_05875 [Niabella sp.]
MFRYVFIILLFAIPLATYSQQCYELNSGAGLKLYSPFLLGTPLGIPQLKGSRFGDYVTSSLCNGKPKRWSIAAYNFNGKPLPVFAAHAGVANIYTTTSITGEDGQVNDAVWIDGDSITTSYMGIRPTVSNGQYLYAGQLIGTIYTDVINDNFGFGIRRAHVLNPIQKRGYLPSERDANSECACTNNPLWPEYFVNPASVRISYYAYNEVLPEATLKITIEPGGVGQWSFDNGTTWLNSGEKITGLPYGHYKIIF